MGRPWIEQWFRVEAMQKAKRALNRRSNCNEKEIATRKEQKKKEQGRGKEMKARDGERAEMKTATGTQWRDGTTEPL